MTCYLGAGYFVNSHFGISNRPILHVHTIRAICLIVKEITFHIIILNVTIIKKLELDVNVSYSVPFIDDITIVFIPALCTDGEISLYSGVSSRHGNVRVCINGTWSKICGYGNSVVDDNLASVICSELGYSPYGILIM